MKIDNYYEFGPKSEKAPTSIVLLLHGVGSNGRDLISLAPAWADTLPDTVFVSPDAPTHCDMVPPGYSDSYQWFSLQSRDPSFLLEGAKRAAPALGEFIDEQLARFGLPASKLALAGFSQGTMMSLYAAPRYKNRIAGILGYSGALIGAEELNAPDAHKIPVHLIHGEHDDVVPIGAYHTACEALGKCGYTVSGHTTPRLTHSIDQKGIDSGGAFLGSVLR